MRATWYTSLIAGFLFAVIASRLEAPAGSPTLVLLVAVFFITGFIGVIGIPQLREMHEERRRRGLGMFGVMVERSDFARFYFPTWGRMFVWFCGTAVASLALNAFFE